ncbi:MAG: hypothetical protein ISS70_09835 [Phycisphaerae bacterium]|nr:hypothetical protein [Phycisphaerae bacterium]
MKYYTIIQFVDNFRRANPRADKQEIIRVVSGKFGLRKYRSIYACSDFAVRFSAAKTSSFSNCVCGLAALRQFDSAPFIVVVIRPDTTEYLLANTTFLNKISHSSHELRVDNIRGTFLGSNILREFSGLVNCPDNFELLFAMHQEFSWEQNLERLVEATCNIQGTGHRYCPTQGQREAILLSPQMAASLTGQPEYLSVQHDLASRITAKREKILEHSQIDNVNIRGNMIEQEITGGVNKHGLGDIVYALCDGIELQVEIKTKLLHQASCPAAYNVDKALEALGNSKSLIAFCFVGIDPPSRTVLSSTVSIFDGTVLDATRVQFHWAGRNSRGVTQLTGDLTKLFSTSFKETIDVAKAQQFLHGLVELS